MNRTILALDIGTSCGWACQRRSGSIESGRVQLPKGEREGVRVHAFRNFLADVLTRAGDIDFVAWEHAFHQLGEANQVHHRLVGVLLDFCERNRIGYLSVPTSTLKKFATGSGRADKLAMIEAARRAGFNVASHDEADALHVLRLVLARGLIEKDAA